MTRATSAFLDVLRLGAAFVVFFAHTAHYWNPSLVAWMQGPAHDAVIVFFVLSGYVIAFSAVEKKQDARGYALARLSRLYSVVIPALLLTAALWPMGSAIDPAIYFQYERGGVLFRYAASATFMNELWRFDAYPPSNTPFWSLGYEAWYYVFFAIVLYVRSKPLKISLLIAGAILLGPKVLLLMPVWLAGAAAYFWRERWAVSRTMAAVGFVVALVAGCAAMRWFRDWPQAVGTEPWSFSAAWGTDLVVGLCLSAAIWFFARAFGKGRVPDSVYRVIRWSANHTFSLYLYHAPLVIFATALVPPLGGDAVLAAVVMGSILLLIVGLAALTEGQRKRWHGLFGAIWDRCVPRRVAV